MKFVKLSKHLLVNTSRFSANAGNKNHVVRSARVHSPAYVNIRIQAQDHAHAHVSFARVLSRLILYLLPRNKNTKAYGTRVHTHTHREREREKGRGRERCQLKMKWMNKKGIMKEMCFVFNRGRCCLVAAVCIMCAVRFR